MTLKIPLEKKRVGEIQTRNENFRPGKQLDQNLKLMVEAQDTLQTTIIFLAPFVDSVNKPDYMKLSILVNIVHKYYVRFNNHPTVYSPIVKECKKRNR